MLYNAIQYYTHKASENVNRNKKKNPYYDDEDPLGLNPVSGNVHKYV